MRYVSTRGGGPPLSFVAAVERGLAPDGGLYVPRELPESAPGVRVDELLVPFLAPDFSPAEVRHLVRSSLDFSLPLRHLEGSIHLLELFHGPSGAFKDVGARFLARVLGRAAHPESPATRSPPATAGPTPAGPRPRTVLVATSGDTGGAVAAAFDGVPGTRVLVLFPSEGVTPLQRRQFTTLGDNVLAVAVPGPFDACQALVRTALADAELRARHRLTSANSINLGRLLPQMLYYVHAARLLAAGVRGGEGGGGAGPTFVVPSGNLGNLTAGVMAARVAIPDAHFVGAVNRNRALLRWLASGIVDAEAETVATPSTAMDVGRPSNLERLVWLGQGTPGGLRERVSGEGVDDEATLSTIRDVHERHGVLICPHTAVGVAAARARVRAGEGGPYIVLATAHAGKFAEVVVEATGRAPELPPRLARLEGRAERIVPLAAASPEAGHRELARLLEEGRSA